MRFIKGGEPNRQVAREIIQSLTDAGYKVMRLENAREYGKHIWREIDG